MPAPSRSATLKQSAPPANESGSSPPNSSAMLEARFVVTAWSGRPDRYIVGSRSKTVRQFSTSSVFDSFRPNATPRAAAARRRLWNIGTASTHFRSWPNAASGIGTSANPRSLVDDAPHLLGAQQRRVALHRGVQAALLDQVERDPLDLLGRAAMHRGQRDRVGEAGRDLDLADRREVTGDDLHVRRQVGGRVGHRVEVPLDVRPQHPLEVVADAHVEDHARPLAGEPERPVQGVDQDPGPQVLVERLVDLELLRPLDVVALVLHVDAGLVDVELVEGLDRLELDQASADQPRGDDVLGHLGVGAGRDPERRLELHPVDGRPEAMVRAGDEEGRARHVEQGVVRRQLGEDPARELLHRERMEPVGHRVLPRHWALAWLGWVMTGPVRGGRAGGPPAPGPWPGSRRRRPVSAGHRRRRPRHRP